MPSGEETLLVPRGDEHQGLDRVDLERLGEERLHRLLLDELPQLERCGEGSGRVSSKRSGETRALTRRCRSETPLPPSSMKHPT